MVDDITSVRNIFEGVCSGDEDGRAFPVHRKSSDTEERERGAKMERTQIHEEEKQCPDQA